ncbi:hypothetical protein GCM10010344_01880 [Streptomyces bluensis]|nr:hypothetical protein GCM10010344_01880 [Streptomyces bluensis]
MTNNPDTLAAALYATTDDVWIVDSTPVECGRSGETVKRSDLVGWAGYGYCDSHSRFFWGLLLDLLAAEPHLVAARPGQTLIGDKNYFRPHLRTGTCPARHSVAASDAQGRTAAARRGAVQATTPDKASTARSPRTITDPLEWII